MSIYRLVALSIFIYILVVQFAGGQHHINKEEVDHDDIDELLKRLFFHKSISSSMEQVPSVSENLVHSSTIRSSIKQSPVSTQPTAYSPSTNPCISNPCQHAGICMPKGLTTYKCTCIGPWRGMHCSIHNACYKSPCENEGTCLSIHDDYWCKCTADYYGTNCQTKFNSTDYTKNYCQPNICNTGRCISLRTTYYCQCPDDRYGEHCEKRTFKRGVSIIQSYYNLLDTLKQGPIKSNIKDMEKSDKDNDIAYYDAKNGIYF